MHVCIHTEYCKYWWYVCVFGFASRFLPVPAFFAFVPLFGLPVAASLMPFFGFCFPGLAGLFCTNALFCFVYLCLHNLRLLLPRFRTALLLPELLSGLVVVVSGRREPDMNPPAF